MSKELILIMFLVGFMVGFSAVFLVDKTKRETKATVLTKITMEDLTPGLSNIQKQIREAAWKTN